MKLQVVTVRNAAFTIMCLLGACSSPPKELSDKQKLQQRIAVNIEDAEDFFYRGGRGNPYESVKAFHFVFKIDQLNFQQFVLDAGLERVPRARHHLSAVPAGGWPYLAGRIPTNEMFIKNGSDVCYALIFDSDTNRVHGTGVSGFALGGTMTGTDCIGYLLASNTRS